MATTAHQYGNYPNYNSHQNNSQNYHPDCPQCQQAARQNLHQNTHHNNIRAINDCPECRQFNRQNTHRGLLHNDYHNDCPECQQYHKGSHNRPLDGHYDIHKNYNKDHQKYDKDCAQCRQYNQGGYHDPHQKLYPDHYYEKEHHKSDKDHHKYDKDHHKYDNEHHKYDNDHHKYDKDHYKYDKDHYKYDKDHKYDNDHHKYDKDHQKYDKDHHKYDKDHNRYDKEHKYDKDCAQCRQYNQGGYYDSHHKPYDTYHDPHGKHPDTHMKHPNAYNNVGHDNCPQCRQQFGHGRGKGLYVVRQDHNIIRANMEKLLSMDSSHHVNRDAKQRLLNDTIAFVSQHDVAKEVVIYRAIKKFDKNKAKVAREQTIEVEKALYDIDQDFGTNVDKSHFYEKLKYLNDILLSHIRDDETYILPEIEQGFNHDDIDNLNTWFDKVKKMAPTRPHPDGPHSAAGNIVSGPAVAFVDMMRDMGKKFTK